MSRRGNDGEQEFGSDSFLDIIANIVGILIILIVVAGVKVARQTAVESSFSTIESEVASTDREQEHISVPLVIPTSDFAKPEPEQKAADEASAGREDLSSEIAELKLFLNDAKQNSVSSMAELDELKAELAQKATDREQALAKLEEQQRLAKTVFGLRASISTTEAKAASFQSTLKSLSRRQKYVADALQQVTYETRQLRETLDVVEAEQQQGERLNHRLSPVGQIVTERELHFRLAAGRIAHIPLESLLERLKSQVMARRNVVMRFHRYEGMAGPVGGFQMQYTVQRETVSPLQALQYGSSAYRMSVAKWTILPSDTLVAEPVDDALRIGSRFRQVLEATEPDTSVTIWLYPEDFNRFRDIRELAHNLNLRVAARPLPEGTPIAGSPSGSRSTSQ